MNIRIRKYAAGIVLFALIAIQSACDAPVTQGEQKVEAPDLVKMIKAGEFDKATKVIEDYQEIFEQDPVNEMYAVVPYRQFIKAAIDKELESSLEQWRKHSDDSFAPYLASCSYSYGSIWKRLPGRKLSRKDLDHLREHCDWALRINPRLPYAYGRLIKAAYFTRNKKESKRWLNQGVTELPASYYVRVAYLLSLDPYYGGSYEDMLAFAEQSQAHVDKNPMLARLMGNAYNELGNESSRNKDYNKAIEYYKKSLEYHIGNNPLISLASSYSSVGEHLQAIDALTRLIAFRPEPGIYKRRARAYSDAGQYENALKDIAVALKEEPKNTAFLRRQADIYFAMEDYKKSLAAYEKVVSINSADARAWRRIAYIKQRKVVDIAGAKKSYMVALTLEPGSARAWHDFSTLLYNDKDERAPVAFQTYLKICDSGASCDPVSKSRSRKFLDCVEENPSCELELREYEAWIPNV